MVLGLSTNFRSTCPTMQAFGRTSSKTCSSQLELQREHGRGSLLQKDEVESDTEEEAGPVRLDSTAQVRSSFETATCHSGASRCGCAGRHLRDAAGEGAAGVCAAAAPAAPPPSRGARSPRTGESGSRSRSALLEPSDSRWSVAGPPAAPPLL